MKTKKKIFLLLKILMILVILCFIVYCGLFLVPRSKDVNRTNNDTVRASIEAEISDIIFFDEHARLYVLINDNKAAIDLQEDTVIKDSKGKDCNFGDLVIGQVIEATVDPNVWYDAWRDTEKGIDYEMNVYFRCYKITIR